MTTGRAYAGESAAERDLRRREQLLGAGLEIFGTEGYRSATVRGICRAAKVADRNFYDSFGSLEDLLLAVYRDCTDRLTAALTTAFATAPDGDLAAVTEAGVTAFLDVVSSDPRLARVVWIEVIGVSARVDTAYRASMTDFGLLVLGLMPAELRDPAASEAEMTLLAEAAIGGVSHAIATWVVSGMERPRQEIATMLIRFFRGIAAATAPLTAS